VELRVAAFSFAKSNSAAVRYVVLFVVAVPGVALAVSDESSAPVA